MNVFSCFLPVVIIFVIAVICFSLHLIIRCSEFEISIFFTNEKWSIALLFVFFSAHTFNSFG